METESLQLINRINAATGAAIQNIVGNDGQGVPGRSLRGLQKKLADNYHKSTVKELRSALPEGNQILAAWQAHCTTSTPGERPRHPGQGAWLTAKAAGPLTIPNLAYRHGCLRRLGLPSIAPGHTCQRTLANGRNCGQAVDPIGSHLMSCNWRLVMHRHNTLRDHIASYCQQAGLPAHTEQYAVFGPHLRPRPQPQEAQDHDEEEPAQGAPRRQVHKADVCIAGVATAAVYVDVRVTQAPCTSTMDAHLAAQERRKREEYGEPNPMPPGIHAGLRPFILETRGRAAPAAQEVSQWLVNRRAARLQSHRKMAYGAAMTQAIQEFWEPISCALVRVWGKALAEHEGST